MTRRAEAVLLLVTLFWGTTFTLVKLGLDHASTFAFLAVRFAIGAAALALFARRQVLNWAVNRAGLLLGCAMFLGFALQTAGLRLTTPSRSAFLTGLTVVGIPVASAFLARRPQPTSWLGVALLVLAAGHTLLGGPGSPGVEALRLAMLVGGLGLIREVGGPVRLAVGLAGVGLALLTRPEPGAPQGSLSLTGPGVLWGDLLTVGCAVAFGAHLLLTERLLRRLPALPLTFGQFLAVCGLSTVLTPLTGPRFESCPALWGSLLFCGVVCTAGCLGLQTWALGRTTATRASLIFALEPVFAAAFAWAWSRETLPAEGYLGGGLIVAGTLVEPLTQLARRQGLGGGQVAPAPSARID